jgi:hypothetical protein
MSFQVYGKKLKIIDERFTLFIYKFIQKYHLAKIYKKIGPYITVVDNKIKFIDQSLNTLKKHDYNVERINFLLETLMTIDKLTIFIHKYITQQTEWDSHDDQIENMINELIVYLKNIIKISIK